MHDVTIHNLSLKDDLFAKYADDFDHILADIVKNMNEQQVEEAEITAKVSIKLDMVEVPSPTAANINAYREALTPTIKHTISSTIKIKNEKKGCIPEGYELVMDPATGKFVLVKISDGQATMFDDDQRPRYSQVEVDGEVRDAEEDPLGLPDAPNALPEPQRCLTAGDSPEDDDDDIDIGEDFE